MRLLVTGGAGYIGSVVSKLLLEDGHEVTVLDDLSTGHRDAVPPGARFVHASITEAEGVLAEAPVDAVMHFAAKSLVAESVQQPQRYWRNNVAGTLALLEAMRRTDVPILVFSSTAAVYGEAAEMPITTEAAPNPTNPYGASKLAVDLMLDTFASAHGLAAVSLRYFNVAGAYGPYGERHTNETHLIPIALQVAAGTRDALEIYGTDYPTADGSAIRDYIHVRDLADAHLLAMRAAQPGRHAVYNLGTGTGTSVLQVADAVRKVTGVELPTAERARRPGDPAVLVADGSLASAELGWRPRFGLDEMIADAWTLVAPRPSAQPTRVRLSDGRELLYFDDDGPRPHPGVDSRRLQAPVATSQIRWDPMQREHAVIAGHRQQRTFRPPTAECPLCPSTAEHASEVPDQSYDVVVFENRFAALSEQAHAPTLTEPFAAAPATGRCEVVLFTDQHNKDFSSLTPGRAKTIVDAWAHRTAELRTLPTVKYVYCFENRGDEIGVTLAHPHGQIYAYPFVPPRADRAVQSLRAHADRTGRCLQCDVLDAEIAAAERIVVAAEHWVAYVPFAARWPYELRLVARRHVAGLPELAAPERDELAVVYLDVLQRLDALFETPTPYIAGWEQSPADAEDVWHLSADLFTLRRAPDKLKYLAGSESGAGVWINDISPEVAARTLRGDPP